MRLEPGRRVQHQNRAQQERAGGKARQDPLRLRPGVKPGGAGRQGERESDRKAISEGERRVTRESVEDSRREPESNEGVGWEGPRGWPGLGGQIVADQESARGKNR